MALVSSRQFVQYRQLEQTGLSRVRKRTMEHTAEKIRADKRPTIVALEATFNDLLKGVAPAADERLNALRHVVFAILALDKSEPQAFETLKKLKPDFELLLADDLDTSLKPADDVIHDSVDEDVGEGIGEILTA